MARKKNAAQAEKPETQTLLPLPDIAILARYSPIDSVNAHPDWIKTRFPTYIDAHAGHEAEAIREFTHDGHIVRVVTTYRVEVDGQPVRTHLSVDEDGQVFTHATPFVTYASAVDLMKAVIDAYPDSFSEEPGTHKGHHSHSQVREGIA